MRVESYDGLTKLKVWKNASHSDEDGQYGISAKKAKGACCIWLCSRCHRQYSILGTGPATFQISMFSPSSCWSLEVSSPIIALPSCCHSSRYWFLLAAAPSSSIHFRGSHHLLDIVKYEEIMLIAFCEVGTPLWSICKTRRWIFKMYVAGYAEGELYVCTLW